MQRDWTKVGEQARIEHGIPQAKIEAAIEAMEWQLVPCQMAMGPGMAIKEAVKSLHIPKVSHVADSHRLAPFGLIGIFGHYTNGDSRIYIIDLGDSIVPVCIDFEPKQATAEGGTHGTR